MFKRHDEVVSFIDYMEEFINSAIYYAQVRSFGPDEAMGEAASVLNKKRAALEEYVMALAEIKYDSESEPVELKCPDCGSDMKLRTNRQNGDKFWGCTKYPKCRGTRDENGLSKAEREEAKYKKEQVTYEGGFSFNRDKRNPVTEVSPPVSTGWVNPFAKK